MRGGCIGLAAALLFASDAAHAEDVEYSAMKEYSDACMQGALSVADIQSRLVELDWQASDNEDVSFTVTPDDILEASKAAHGFTVELDGGGQWLAGAQTTEIAGYPAVYCSLVFAGGEADKDGVLSDYKTLYPMELQTGGDENEQRYVAVKDGDTSFAVLQFMQVPDEDDLIMFRITQFTALVSE